MTMQILDHLLHPCSIAVVGASGRKGSVGERVLRNVVDAGFGGPIFAINPHALERDGVQWIASVADLPFGPDIAVIATPASTVPEIIGALGEKGTRIAIIISSGFHDPERRKVLLAAARPHGLRVIGPNCLGVLLPHARLNGSFAQAAPRPGGLALLSQSGALVTSMIDWGNSRGVGFSGVVSLGDGADADFGDLIDLFASDPQTRAIALYVEGVQEAAKFMSAARAAARTKPVIVLKAGRSAAAGRAAISHTGAIAGAYDVHVAAFRRAGMITVDTLGELFDAAQMVAHDQPYRGKRLAIISNGGGAGVLAADALQRVGGELAELAPSTFASLDARLPAGWSRFNPIDVVGDARADRFVAALDGAMADPGSDAVLVIHCPTAVATGASIARAIAKRVGEAGFRRTKPILACWMGPRNAEAARPVFASAGIPMFESLDDAVRGFGYLIAARAARDLLMRTPPRLAIAENDLAKARAVIGGARLDSRTTLTATEAKAILDAFGIPVVRGRFACTADAVEQACAGMQPPFAVKIVSPDLTHKSDVGGVALKLSDAAAAAAAAKTMAARLAHAHPGARLFGFDIEPMVDLSGQHELIVGIADDQTFGPVIAVGAGGTSVEIEQDRALGLPPLDAMLAHAMIAETRISRRLAGYRDVPPADTDSLTRVLGAVAAIAAELPDVAELDINPLVVGPTGALALDARIRITEAPATSRMVIRPVPVEWTADLETRQGTKLHVRPVMPHDEVELAALFRDVSPDDLRFRFLTALREVSHEQLAAMTQIDYRRQMHFLAFAGELLVASAFLTTDPDGRRAEFALAIRAGWKNRGIAWTLTEHLLRYAKAEGIESIESLESADNAAALQIERELGFSRVEGPTDATEILVRKKLIEPVALP